MSGQWYGKQIANVKVCIDFPGVENYYVVSVPVYHGERLTEKVRDAADWALDSLAKDAGRLVAEKLAD